MAGKKSGLLQIYLNQIRHFPLLNSEQEREMALSIQQGDGKVRQKLVESNLRLVVKIARSYLSTGVSFLDLIQEGNIGLIRAVERFNPEKKVRLSTYSSWWIRYYIFRYLANKHRIIRLPHRKEEILWKAQKAYFELTQRLNRTPTAKEIAMEIGVPMEDIDAILSVTTSILPLDSFEPGSVNILRHYEDYTYNPEQALLKKESTVSAMRLLSRLKERERKIIMYRYRFNNSGRQSLKTIGDKMGISPETVRQIEMKALKKIKFSPELLNYFG